jgi:hypothetical protein
MNLDFSVFSQPSPKPLGTLGTEGTANVHEGVSVPTPFLPCGNSGNNFSDAADLFPVFPVPVLPVGTEIAAIYAGVPRVPSVPTQKADVCADEDLLDPLRQPFVAWFDARIHLDARGIALRQTPTWSTTVDALHADFVRWTLERDQAPPTGEQFRLLLRELGCSLRTIAGDEFVDYVALKEDVQAHEQFERRSE